MSRLSLNVDLLQFILVFLDNHSWSTQKQVARIQAVKRSKSKKNKTTSVRSRKQQRYSLPVQRTTGGKWKCAWLRWMRNRGGSWLLSNVTSCKITRGHGTSSIRFLLNFLVLYFLAHLGVFHPRRLLCDPSTLPQLLLFRLWFLLTSQHCRDVVLAYQWPPVCESAPCHPLNHFWLL